MKRNSFVFILFFFIFAIACVSGSFAMQKHGKRNGKKKRHTKSVVQKDTVGLAEQRKKTLQGILKEKHYQRSDSSKH